MTSETQEGLLTWLSRSIDINMREGLPGAIVAIHFPREASLYGETEHNKLQAPLKKSSGVYKELQDGLVGLSWSLSDHWIELCLGLQRRMAPLWLVYPRDGQSFGGNKMGERGASKRHWLRIIFSLLLSSLLQQGNAVIQGLCSVIALGEHVGKPFKPARGSGSRAWLVLNSWQRERACVLHLNTLQSDRWWVRGMRSISLARCFELPSIRNNKGSHCLSRKKGRS